MPHRTSKSPLPSVGTAQRPSRKASPPTTSLTRLIALLALAFQPSCAIANRTSEPPPETPASSSSPIDPPSQSTVDLRPEPSESETFSSEPAPATTPDTPRAQPPSNPTLPPTSQPPVSTQPTAVTPPTWERERALIIDRLVQASRRLFDAAPQEQHGELLVALLADEIPEMRTLGLTLVEEELADAERLSPDVGVALARLLNSPEPRVRLAAARLLNRLAQPGLEDAITAALDVETEPAVVAELLAAAVRQPSPRLVAPTLRWLGTDSVARESASQAALTLDRADLLTADDRADAAEKLRSRAVTSFSAPGIRLFARVGTDADRRSLLPLLRTPEPATRLAAAEALSRYAPFVNDLVIAAIDDPMLVDFAVRAIASHSPSLEGLLLLRALPFATPEAFFTAASQVTPGMDLATLILAADESYRTPNFVEAIFSSLADAPFPADPELAIQHARGLVRLAESQLNLSRPGRALSLADRADPYEPSLPQPDQERLSRVRTLALVWLDRLDDPGLANSTSDHWLDALELLATQPQGPEISDAFLTRFGHDLTPEQRDRFLEIEAKFLTGPRPLNRATPADVPQSAPPPRGAPPVGPR